MEMEAAALTLWKRSHITWIPLYSRYYPMVIVKRLTTCARKKRSLRATEEEHRGGQGSTVYHREVASGGRSLSMEALDGNPADRST
ncbi:hypothetical protein TNCV_1000081 [Trichonephila clavipes]|nr:hypothetical protein TNCV_1000081 [Trichonephila clavipes]